MKIAYFLMFETDRGSEASVAVEAGAEVRLTGELQGLASCPFRVLSMKDRLAEHNREAKKAANGTPRFTDEDRFLLWLHQSGEKIHYRSAGEPLRQQEGKAEP